MDTNDKKRIREYYDKFSPKLGDDIEIPNKRHERFKNHIRNVLSRGEEVLDLGCGVGITSHFMGRLGANVTAVDISPKNIEHAIKHRIQKNVTYLVGDITDLDLKQEYDGIVIWDAFEHIPQQYTDDLMWTINTRAKEKGSWVFLNIPDGRYIRAARKFIPDRLQIVDEAWDIEDIIQLFKMSDFELLSLDIYGINAVCQYNTFIFRRTRDIRNAHENALGAKA